MGLLVIANGVGSIRDLGVDDVLVVRDADVVVALPEEGPPRLLKHRHGELRELSRAEVTQLRRGAREVVELGFFEGDRGRP